MKTILKTQYQTLHRVLGLSNLSMSEERGSISWATRLKLLPRSAHHFPFKTGITVRGISVENIYQDVFARALRSSRDNFNPSRFSDELAKELENEKQLGISFYNPAISRRHHDKPAWASVLPWDDISCDEMFDQYENLVFQNRSQQLSEHPDDFSSKDIYGDRMVESHRLQFASLYDNLKTFGFVYGSDLPRVNILVDGKNWRWMMTGQGNHRFYLLHLLGYRYFPCELGKIVDFKHAHKWPNVINGDYSVSSARRLFHRIIAGRNPVRGII